MRDDLSGRIAGDEVVEDVSVDRVAVGVPLELWVQRRGVGDNANRQRVLYGLRERDWRGAEQESEGGNSDAHGKAPFRGIVAWQRTVGATWHKMPPCA